MNAATDKPEGEKLGWKTSETEILYRGKTFALRRDVVHLGDKRLNYEYEKRAAAVIIVPVTSAGEIVLIRQYRYPVDAWCLETPAGGCHDVGEMPLEEVVRKELREEIGAGAGALDRIGWFFSAPSFTDEKGWIYLAWDVELQTANGAERGNSHLRAPGCARHELRTEWGVGDGPLRSRAPPLRSAD